MVSQGPDTVIPLWIPPSLSLLKHNKEFWGLLQCYGGKWQTAIMTQSCVNTHRQPRSCISFPDASWFLSFLETTGLDLGHFKNNLKEV